MACALILARTRRRVLLLDAGGQRNEVSLEQHAVLGADGCNREQYLKQAREQVGSAVAEPPTPSGDRQGQRRGTTLCCPCA